MQYAMANTFECYYIIYLTQLMKSLPYLVSCITLILQIGEMSIRRLRDFPKITQLVSDKNSSPLVLLFPNPFLSHHSSVDGLI